MLSQEIQKVEINDPTVPLSFCRPNVSQLPEQTLSPDPEPEAMAAAELMTDAWFEILYEELRRQARSRMRREAQDHTLSATALTHEVWFRLSEQQRIRWRNKEHFMAMSAMMMRRILVNHAVAQQTRKRRVDAVPLTEIADLPADLHTADEVLRIHNALLAFEQVDSRAAKVVELKFFAGLEGQEIADLLGISVPTVKRDWAWARAWLHRELAAD